MTPSNKLYTFHYYKQTHKETISLQSVSLMLAGSALTRSVMNIMEVQCLAPHSVLLRVAFYHHGHIPMEE